MTDNNNKDDHQTFELSSEMERKIWLHRIWVAQAKALVAVLETDEPGKLQAATLNTARQFLADQGVRSDTLDNPVGDVDPATEELVASLKGLGVGDGDDEGAGALPKAEPEPAGDDHQDWPDRLEIHHDEGNL